MWMFILEAALALALLFFIVWWTLAPVHRRERKKAETVEPTQLEQPPDRAADDTGGDRR